MTRITQLQLYLRRRKKNEIDRVHPEFTEETYRYIFHLIILSVGYRRKSSDSVSCI